MSRPAPEDIHALVGALAETKKYGRICQPVLERTAEWALARNPQPKAALKAAKRKLHQVFGAFIQADALAQLETRLDEAPWGEPAALRAWSDDVLRLHASTAERLPYIDKLYKELFAVTGAPRRVVDLGAGLNPFSHASMHLPNNCEYNAVEMDRRLVSAYECFFEAGGIIGRAEAADLLTWRPQATVEVAFLFKLLPTLEQEASGAAEALMIRTGARYCVVSFPTRSLGGRAVGMGEHYGRLVLQMVQRRGWEVHLVQIPSEDFYIVRTGGSARR